MELLDFEAKEPKEDAQAVRPALFARKDDALAAKGARAEGEEAVTAADVAAPAPPPVRARAHRDRTPCGHGGCGGCP